MDSVNSQVPNVDNYKNNNSKTVETTDCVDFQLSFYVKPFNADLKIS